MGDEKFYVVTGDREEPLIETTRTNKNSAERDVRLLRDICRKRPRIMTHDPREL